MIQIKHSGNFRNIAKFFNTISRRQYLNSIEDYGLAGAEALASATPMNTGETASKWSYEVSGKDGLTTLTWKNTAENKGVNIVGLLVSGHGTGTGGYVPPNDFVKPAIDPVVEAAIDYGWKGVTKA